MAEVALVPVRPALLDAIGSEERLELVRRAGSPIKRAHGVRGGNSSSERDG